MSQISQQSAALAAANARYDQQCNLLLAGGASLSLGLDLRN
ncbi:hypothetical protein ACVXHA_03060 [Escherichia coli]